MLESLNMNELSLTVNSRRIICCASLGKPGHQRISWSPSSVCLSVSPRLLWFLTHKSGKSQKFN